MKEHIMLVRSNPPLTVEKVKRSGAKVSKSLLRLARAFRDLNDPHNSHSRAEMMKIISFSFNRIEK